VKRLGKKELKSFLDEKVEQYNRTSFIEDDPVSIPHRFSKKEDIEIAGFLAATLAWGQRKTILSNAGELLRRMDNSPHHFILNHTRRDYIHFRNFKHRTFNGDDTIFFLQSLKKIYSESGSIENIFQNYHDKDSGSDFKSAIAGLRKSFFNLPHPKRTTKHFSDPVAGSASKRLNMFLRWMIRKDSSGVDFGLWSLDPALLTCPLDVHSGRVARRLGLLKRKQNDWQAAVELTNCLREFDRYDPVKYDFALFGLGVYEKF
jgi:uncharacterized protein (TIGR02757 family)